MATVSLIVTDLDLTEGTYKVDFAAQGSEIDEGKATAAYFTGFYLHTLLQTPDFLAGVGSFGRQLIDAMSRERDRSATFVPAVMTLTLEDADLKTGRYTATLTGSGGDESGESLPTPAQIIAGYMRYLVSDMAFRNACWAFAEEYVANNKGAMITNLDQGPLSVNDDCPVITAA